MMHTTIILTTVPYTIIRVNIHHHLPHPRTVLTAVSPPCHHPLRIHSSGTPRGGVPVYGGAGGDDPVVEDEGEQALPGPMGAGS